MRIVWFFLFIFSFCCGKENNYSVDVYSNGKEYFLSTGLEQVQAYVLQGKKDLEELLEDASSSAREKEICTSTLILLAEIDAHDEWDEAQKACEKLHTITFAFSNDNSD